MLDCKYTRETVLPLALAAYCLNQPKAPTLPTGWTLENTIGLNGNLADTVLEKLCPKEEIGTPLGFVASNADTQAIVFRGTQTHVEWADDFDCRTQAFGNVDGHPVFVECGFLTVYKALTGSLPALDHSKRIIVVGHSLGGALAQLYTFDQFANSLSAPPVVYTFGSPRAGGALFAARFPAMCWRMVNVGDIVPHTPPELFGYVHVGTAVEVNGFKDPLDLLRAAHSLVSYDDGLLALSLKLSRIAA